MKALIEVEIDKSVGRRRSESASGKEVFAINPKAMALSAAKESQGLRQAMHAGLLSPEEALLWYTPTFNPALPGPPTMLRSPVVPSF